MSTGTAAIAPAVIFIPCQPAVPSTWVGTGFTPPAAASLLTAALLVAAGVGPMSIPLMPLMPLMSAYPPPSPGAAAPVLAVPALASVEAVVLALPHPAASTAISATGAQDQN